MTCTELAAASFEIEAGANAFRAGVDGLTPEQTDRARTLSSEVGRELQAESARRCAPGTQRGIIGTAPVDRQDPPLAVQ